MLSVHIGLAKLHVVQSTKRRTDEAAGTFMRAFKNLPIVLIDVFVENVFFLVASLRGLIAGFRGCFWFCDSCEKCSSIERFY